MSFFLVLLLATGVSYLLGSVPTGYLVGRAYGVDVRRHGSGNIGATNVLRVLRQHGFGSGPGYLVFFCDAFKGFLAVSLCAVLARRLLPAAAGLPTPALTWIGLVAGLACIVGHNFTVWLQFRGGKGIATTTGVLLGLMPVALLVALVVWGIVFGVWRYVSLASLCAAATLPLVVGALAMLGWRGVDGPLFAFSVLAAALAFWRHRSNLQRLAAGTEARFGPPRSGPSPAPGAASPVVATPSPAPAEGAARKTDGEG